MKSVKCLLILLALVCFAAAAPAHGQRRRGSTQPPSRAIKKPVATPQPSPVVTSPVAAAPKAPIPLATVNGQTITTAEIDPKVREEVEAVDARIEEARRQILDLQVNTLLLEAEAAKRRITPQQLYDLEVVKKIAEPTESEINKVIEENRDQISQTDPAAIRSQVVMFLKGERETRISGEFVKRLRASSAVVNVTDPATPGLAPSTVVATVSGRPVTVATINERLKPIAYKLRLNSYSLAKQALDVTINDLLLLAEANRRNVGPEEIVRKEISEKVRPPTETEVAKFYEENKTRLTAELPAIKNQIASYLQEQDRQRLEQALSDRLRKGADIRILISEPTVPVQSISVDDDPVRGDSAAPVTIVEFTDFQCPSCAAMQPILEEVLKSYGSKVKLVVRDFPLAMHPNARKAAEAANAANAQGKFFEYTALLLKRQNSLDVPSLKKYASELGLDRARFDAALDSGKYAAEVKHDIDDGEFYGVDSTPAIFVNGIALREMSAEALRALIDRGLGTGSKVSAR